MIINIALEGSDKQICIYNWLPNKDDFWVFGQSFYTDYYVIHEPLEGRIGIVPTERRKKPPLREDPSIPETGINDTFIWSVFITKILLIGAAGGATYYGAEIVLRTGTWGGVA